MKRKVVETPASVCLEGAVLKRLREEKRLTQLYVSKVVGVTTDTVSRWENNRYPSMRRDNALKLAEALDVPLDELLRRPPAPAEVAAPPRNLLPLVVASVLAVAVMTGLLLLILRQTGRQVPPPASITAERILPPFAAPGSDIPVQVKLVQRADDSGFILREYLPKGWKLLQANPPASSVDNDNGMVRWIVKAGDGRDRIVYLVRVDSAAAKGSNGIFQGEVVAGSADSKAAVPVHGDGRVAVAPVMWVDRNGDGRIDDGEMLQASYTVDDMAGVKIDWLELERLWSAGSYRWDEKQHIFIPLRQPESPPATSTP
jgi:transcriptional regulator with XRE-family HTH domain